MVNVSHFAFLNMSKESKIFKMLKCKTKEATSQDMEGLVKFY